MKKAEYPSPSPSFPMRLNRCLAIQGHATRRGADDLISAGKVFINGKRAVLGDKVNEGDEVEVRHSKKARAKAYHYFAFNKPRGVITHSPDDSETDVRESLPEELASLDLFPVGRLDKGSHGLLILTDDGRITDRLLNPSREHDKEYTVRTKLPLRLSFKQHMEAGVLIEGYTTKPAKIRILGEQSFSITLTEGKKHQIRRMVVAMHNEVVDLKRTRVLNIKLGKLKAGEARPIEGEELGEFLALLGLAETR